jgi:hypothetical protein
MTRTTAAIAAALLAAACGSEPARLDYYTLSSPPAQPVAGAPATFTVHVGPVSVPDGVDRPQMVLRLDDNRVAIDDNHHWVEPLKNAIPRVLSDALARELDTPRVMTSRQSSALDIDYRVAVDVQHFESSTSEVSEDVIWTIRSPRAKTPRLGRSVVRESASGGYEGIAAAHSRALERVAHDIAEAIRAMQGR